MATAYFMQLVILMTEAKTDQDHIEMIIYNNPFTPDRTSYILGKSKESPVPEMVRMGKQLASQNVEVLAIPCMTAHHFHAQLEEEIQLPIVHGIRQTADYLAKRGVACAGIMATDGTIQSKIFQEELACAGIKSVIPTVKNQKKVMELIYDDIKAGRRANMKKFEEVSKELRGNGAEVVILGCTELSVIKRDEKLSAGYLDAMEVLAQSCVKQCGKLKEEYEELITRDSF